MVEYVFAILGHLRSLEEVAKSYDLEPDIIRRFIEEWVNLRKPTPFIKEVDRIYVLEIRHGPAFSHPLIKMMRKWGKGYRGLKGDKGEWFSLAIKIPLP